MTQNMRKFAGILILLLVLIGYCVLAVTLHEWLFSHLPVWVQLIYFAIAGVGWAIPAGITIKWMARPDSQ